MDVSKSKSSTNGQLAYRLVWSSGSGEPMLSDLLTRGDALAQFDNLNIIRRGCTPHTGQRLRVVAETERLAAIKARAEAALVAL